MSSTSATVISTIQLTDLVGVGPKTQTLLKQLHIYHFIDLLFHLPLRYEDRTRITPLSAVVPGDRVLIQGKVVRSQVVGRRSSLTVEIDDGTAKITLRFFHFNQAQRQRFENVGVELRCFGEVRQGFQRRLEMVHPECRDIRYFSDLELENHLTPIYPTTKGLSQNLWRRLIQQALVKLSQCYLQELLPLEIKKRFRNYSLIEALRIVHMPPPEIVVEKLLAGQHPAQLRLAFEELLAHNVSLQKLRQRFKRQAAVPLTTSGRLRQALLKALPFQLTAAQQRVVNEIITDLSLPHPMLRLVQGDVGSGKTVVAALAILQAIESGFQAVLMAPTEILAEQHLKNFQNWLTPLNVNVGWLVGKQNSAQRQAVLAEIAAGQLQVIVGTHALLQEDVEFARLALVVIDEQHRFGVHQRLALTTKGQANRCCVHQLIMTATPIPRTLAMSAYADLDLSVIDELPPGRQPITTITVSQQRRDEIVQRVGANCRQGYQAYWVCTLIEESEVLQCRAAENTFADLKKLLPDLQIGLVHGRLKSEEKEQLMQAFKKGEIDLLIATTVVEVGVDVPNANLMVIDNAERLGLAQLHQLRGRVGRGQVASHCVLLYQKPISPMAQQRLAIMRKTQNGFEIAKVDLQMRGPGEVLGTRQSGLMQFRIADIVRDQAWLPEIQRYARALLMNQSDHVPQLINRWLKGLLQYHQV